MPKPAFTTPAPPRWTTVALAVSVAFILALVLEPQRADSPGPGFLCVVCGSRGSADFFLNVLLFLPFGAAFGARGADWRAALVRSLLLSLAIELVQTQLPGRTPSLRDVIANGIGGAVGAWVVHGPALWPQDPRRAKWWLATLIAGSAAAASVAAWLLQPSSSASQFYGQVVPRLAHLEPWTGRVDSVRIGGEMLRHGRIDGTDAFRRALRAPFSVSISGVHGEATSRLGAIVAVTDESRREMLLVGPNGTDLVLRWQRRASRLRLDAPWVRMPRAFASARAGDPLQLDITGMGDSVCAQLDGRSVGCAPPVGVERSWAMLLWRDRWHPAAQRTLDVATLVLLVLPVGLGARRVAGRLGWFAPLAVVLLVGLLPTAIGAAPLDGLEWAALIIGAAGPRASVRGGRREPTEHGLHTGHRRVD